MYKTIKPKFYKKFKSINVINDIVYYLTNYGKYDDLFDTINIIADFVQSNSELLDLDSFQQLTELVVMIIENINMNKYTKDDISTYGNSLLIATKNLKLSILDSFEVSLYYVGQDNSWVLDTLNEQCNMKIYNNAKVKEDDESFKILLCDEEFYDLNGFDIYIDLRKIKDVIYDICLEDYLNDYEYNYLNNSLISAKHGEWDTIIIGNSHLMTGVKEDILESKAINLSLSSQDLFYSYKLLENILEYNNKIKTCILGVSNYLLYHDLSMCSDDYSQNLIRNVYYPITNDPHNSDVLYKSKDFRLKSKIDNDILKYIFNFDKLQKKINYLIYSDLNGYFNKYVIRENISAMRGRKFQTLSIDEKDKIAQFRANQHNKILVYEKTRFENEQILIDIIKLLNKNNIRCILLNLPTTEYYKKYLDKSFKEQLNNVISGIKLKYEFIDLSESNILQDDDFVDVDHINESGAIKISNYLQQNVL